MLGYITWDVSPYLIGGTPDAAINVRWYSLMFAIGFIVGYNMVARMFKHEGAPEKWLGTLLLWLVGGTMVGARLGHVFFYEWDHYSAHPMEIFKIWEGGLASHGGAIGVIIAVCLFSYFSTKRSPLWTLDRIAAPVALVSCLIRVGNLFNSEIFGPPTDLPWGFKFVNNYTWNRWFLTSHVIRLKSTKHFAIWLYLVCYSGYIGRKTLKHAKDCSSGFSLLAHFSLAS